VDRRAAARQASAEAQARRMRLAPRGVAAAIDTAAILSSGSLAALATALPFWPVVSVTALIYYAVSTVLAGASPGTRLTDMLRQRVPALFAVQDRRAHA
jgi:hypothetical protein